MNFIIILKNRPTTRKIDVPINLILLPVFSRCEMQFESNSKGNITATVFKVRTNMIFKEAEFLTLKVNNYSFIIIIFLKYKPKKIFLKYNNIIAVISSIIFDLCTTLIV